MPEWKGHSVLTHSPSRGDTVWGGAGSKGRGPGCSRMCAPASGLETALTGYRGDTALPETSTSGAARSPGPSLQRRRAEVPQRPSL